MASKISEEAYPSIHKIKMISDHEVPEDVLPRLVYWAGPIESMAAVFDQLTAMPMDVEFIGLLHQTQEPAAIGHLCRGFGIFGNRGVTENAICLAREQNYFNEEKRAVVWLFAGMGSQWCKMGESLQHIEIARDAIDQCHQILEPFGIDLWSIITSDDPAIFDSVLNSFVGINSIQIALVDILRAVNLPIDFIIGHSLGELVCSYADGSMTLQEVIMCSYWQGKICSEEPLIDGRMAAVGLGHVDIRDQLPEGVYVACHNSSTSCTLSGPKEKVEKFVAELQSKGIYAKSVSSNGIAFHSKYIHGMKVKYLEKLKETIAEPKLRSEKWLSTSVPIEDRQSAGAKYSCPDYYLNNFLSPVLFEEAIRELPTNSIIVDIAPCGLLQAIIKRELPSAIHIPMMQKFSKNNSINILKALGKIFIHGIPLRINQLYPPIQFPVSRRAPMIAPLIKWDHSNEWTVSKDNKNGIPRERKVVVNLSYTESEYMKGHVINDRCLLPAMGYLHLVRESLVCMTPGATLDTMNVHFEDMKWLRATSLEANTSVQLTINIHRDSGIFEVIESGKAIVSGTVKNVRSPEPITPLDVPFFTSAPTLKAHDFYKELRIRGYMYAGDFLGVQSARADGRCGRIEWKKDNWVTFMDAMLQVGILSKDSRSLQLPTGIREIKINAADHLNYLNALPDGDGDTIMCDVRMSPELNTIVCGGIEITGMTTTPISRRNQNGVKLLDRYEFVPLNGDGAMYPLNDAVRICTQLIHETLQTNLIRVVEVLDRDSSTQLQPIIEYFQRALRKMPLVNGDFVLMTQRLFPDLDQIDVHASAQLPKSADSTVIVAANCMADDAFIAAAAENLIENGFLISVEPITVSWTELAAPNGFQLLSLVRSESISLVLMQRRSTQTAVKMPNVTIRLETGDGEYKWLKSLQETFASLSTSSITLVSEGNATSGALGFVNCLRREKRGRKIQLVQTDDDSTSAIEEQLTLGLPINIRRNGCWGTYRHMDIMPITTSEYDTIEPTVELNIQKVGDLSSMTWRPAQPTKNFIDVHFAALNFRDVMLASGRLSAETLIASRKNRGNFLGFEFAGVTASGDRVMGISTNGGAMATRIDHNKPTSIWKVPDNMSLREAATIPTVYTTVYYALFVRNEISAGQSILIHAGTGGVGLAAIRVAFAYGLRVFTTVSSEEKRKFLLHEFVDLKENHIGNSRDCSFEKMIMDKTNGQGVDFVLNSLSEKKLIASVRCLRRGGVFLEIGKFDIFNNSNLGMRLFEKGITFRTIFADWLHEMTNDMKIIHDRIETDLACGIIRPLPSSVFAGNDVEKAFRYLSGAKHIGKVLLQLRESEEKSLTLSLKVLPKVVCNPELVYVLVGGLGGFGLELADWLVIRGARNLVLNSRCGAKNAYQLYRIGLWNSYGCNVYISSADTTRRTGCESLLRMASKYGDVGGIFNLAVVLSDHALEKQTSKSFDKCLAPKALSTKHLDELSRRMCSKLEYFVVFSSVVCVLGNASQTNYGMANSIMERIVERRVRDKLPGKAIQWGAVGDVGSVAGMLAGNNDIEVLDTLPQRIDNCLAVMDELMCRDEAIVTSMVVPQKDQAKKHDLVGTVLSILGITDIKSVSIHATLTELGVDSLINNEIKQMLEREYDIQLTTEDIQMLTVAWLEEISTKKEQRHHAVSAEAAGASDATSIAHMGNEPSENIAKANAAAETPRVLLVNPLGALDGLSIEHMGDESTKNLNIIKANSAAETADDTAPCVLVIPGIEGVASDAMIKLCSRLKMPAFILQLHTTHRMNNVDDVVAHLAADILELYKNRERFCIAAYSFGSVLATEVARLLERQYGCHGHIYMIDGNLYAIHKYIDSAFGCYRDRTDERFGTKIIAKVAHNLPKAQRLHAEAKLVKAKTFNEKVDVCVGLLHRSKYSRGYLKECIIGQINRLAIIENTRWKVFDGKINADITLLPATKSFAEHGSNEMAMQTNGKIESFPIIANHATILDSEVLIEMIV